MTMERRQIAILVGAALAAFVVAFGIGKLAGGDEEPAAAAPGEPAAAFDMPTAAIEADVQGQGLPALKPTPTPEPEEEEPEATAAPPSATATATPAPAAPAPTAAPQPTPEPPVTGGGED
jgi:hypothetical protein